MRNEFYESWYKRLNQISKHHFMGRSVDQLGHNYDWWQDYNEGYDPVESFHRFLKKRKIKREK